ncbi:hypothetical protein CYLTODRAFT_460426 [Cylindrobasidium torrendii FP15055 ss-10]|uniref:Retrotransposon gag domain-containing protein n=1 Tax=Cylindrobasidium torrendii FP15055 ss-10 TaxID=1314674 RepID=A0A0D7ARE4_9AGAR|nr:hypothetical protein CYLTODRAFT_460426 [Cylindrobasidium torrendii FP15055 ss-10]
MSGKDVNTPLLSQDAAIESMRAQGVDMMLARNRLSDGAARVQSRFPGEFSYDMSALTSLNEMADAPLQESTPRRGRSMSVQSDSKPPGLVHPSLGVPRRSRASSIAGEARSTSPRLGRSSSPTGEAEDVTAEALDGAPLLTYPAVSDSQEMRFTVPSELVDGTSVPLETSGLMQSEYRDDHSSPLGGHDGLFGSVSAGHREHSGYYDHVNTPVNTDTQNLRYAANRIGVIPEGVSDFSSMSLEDAGREARRLDELDVQLLEKRRLARQAALAARMKEETPSAPRVSFAPVETDTNLPAAGPSAKAQGKMRDYTGADIPGVPAHDLDVTAQRQALQAYESLHNVSQAEQQAIYEDIIAPLRMNGGSRVPTAPVAVVRERTPFESEVEQSSTSRGIPERVVHDRERHPSVAPSAYQAERNPFGPAAHLEPGSSLARMLRGGGGNGRGKSRPESPPGSSSPPSSDTEGSREHRSRRKRKHSHTLKVTKPIDPTAYSGSADIGKYTTFVREMNEYLIVQNDPVRRDPLHIARFLKGTARQWYEDVVADDDPLDWPFERFMQALMNALIRCNYES